MRTRIYQMIAVFWIFARRIFSMTRNAEIFRQY